MLQVNLWIVSALEIAKNHDFSLGTLSRIFRFAITIVFQGFTIELVFPINGLGFNWIEWERYNINSL